MNENENKIKFPSINLKYVGEINGRLGIVSENTRLRQIDTIECNITSKNFFKTR
jgi:hypothetical protein